MHPTTARYLAQTYHEDREREAARKRLAAALGSNKPAQPRPGRIASVNVFIATLLRRPTTAAG